MKRVFVLVTALLLLVGSILAVSARNEPVGTAGVNFAYVPNNQPLSVGFVMGSLNRQYTAYYDQSVGGFYPETLDDPDSIETVAPASLVTLSFVAPRILQHVNNQDYYYSTAVLRLDGLYGGPYYFESSDVSFGIVQNGTTEYLFTGIDGTHGVQFGNNPAIINYVTFTFDTSSIPSNEQLLSLYFSQFTIQQDNPIYNMTSNQQTTWYVPYRGGWFGLNEDSEDAYWDGYEVGYQIGESDGYNYGYGQGRQDGLNEAGIADWSDLLVASVGGFMSFEIIPGFSVGGLFSMILGIGIVMLFLKFFAGG